MWKLSRTVRQSEGRLRSRLSGLVFRNLDRNGEGSLEREKWVAGDRRRKEKMVEKMNSGVMLNFRKHLSGGKLTWLQVSLTGAYNSAWHSVSKKTFRIY